MTAEGESLAVPAFCRVRGEARPAPDSQIGFELWLPAQTWNGRYYQLGNGGFAGVIHYPSLAAELRRGNAVAATDTGHRGERFDATWARGHPERIVDYGYRSLKETSDAARELIRAYYGTAARHRYFTGCSNGGRQALMLVQRYPEDWDGILAGSPANAWTGQLGNAAWIQNGLRAERESWIPGAKLPAIQRAAIASCTADARVIDGVPADPRHCRLRVSELVCRDVESDQCLTPAQAAALERIQDGVREPEAGGRTRYGFEPTAALPGNWSQWIVNPDPRANSQLTLAEQFFQNMVFDDPLWRVERFDAQRDLVAARERSVAGQPLARVLDATDTDLSRLRSSSGKLLMYVGWADALISPRAGVDYYEHVSSRSGGARDTQSFFRLFTVPGMTHCQGGDVPNAFGQAYTAPSLHDDAQHDIRRALEAWVERGVAPTRIVATKYVDDDPSQGAAATRVLRPYPEPPEPLRKAF